MSFSLARYSVWKSIHRTNPFLSRMLQSLNFRKITPVTIEKNTESLIAEQKSIYDSIGLIPLNKVNYNNVLKVLSDAMCERSTKKCSLYFPQHAATDKNLRDASCKADTELEKFDVEMSMRKDVFDRVVALEEKIGQTGLEGEQRRFLEKLIRFGRRNGLHLPEEARNKIKELKTQMAELSIKFNSNLNEDNTKLYFSKEDLAGMPDDFVNDLKEVDGKLEVTLKYPHLFPITKKCRVPKTRYLMTAASQAKCMKKNTLILEELIELRQKKADILGYKTHSAYVLEEKMAKSPERVAEFLSQLAAKLQILWKDELELLYKLKKEECEKFGFEDSGKIEFWDIKYYMNIVEETVFSVDEEEIRQYFPLEKVVAGLFEIYQRLLGLTFYRETEIEGWHDDVSIYRVDDTKSSQPLGYFCLDLHPREGKAGHAEIFPLQPSYINDQGVRQPSLCAMMCNFTKPTKEKPALLTHSEVETFFHEFGHIMHVICDQATIPMCAAFEVEGDFIEAPSQMLENWVWEKEPLRLMSGHCKTGEPLPDALIEKLSASRKANAGGFNLRQIVLGTFDQKIHTMKSADTQQVFKETYQEIMGVTPIEDTNMPASFGHLAGGYDAGYYGYLWSEVFAMDMFESRFKKGGILSAEVGSEYRNKILAPGGTKDASDLLKEFLGRDPNHDAFLRSKGL